MPGPVIEQWRIEYNTERPHSALGYLTPAQYAAATHEALALRASAEEKKIEIFNPELYSDAGLKRGAGQLGFSQLSSPSSSSSV